MDEYGNKMPNAGPSVVVDLVGFKEVPAPGEEVLVVESERRAR